MGRYAREPESGSGFPDVEPGNYVGRCYRVIELGTTHEEYQGEVKTRNRLMISFELPDELMNDGKKAFSEEELAGFDLATIAGVPGMVTVTQNARGRSMVAGVGPLPKGMKCGDAVNETSVFFLDEFDQATFDALPDGIKEMIKKSDEYHALMRPKREPVAPAPGKTNDFDDDIPFIRNECMSLPESRLARRLRRGR